MPCERRAGSRTKLASIESYATPASSTPALRRTCQSYLMLCPPFRTAGSRNSSAIGAHAGSVRGGRLVTGAGAASSPPRGRCPKGRYHAASAAIASERPIRSASWGSSELVSVSRATSDAARRVRAKSGRRAGSSTMEIRMGEGATDGATEGATASDSRPRASLPSPSAGGGAGGARRIGQEGDPSGRGGARRRHGGCHRVRFATAGVAPLPLRRRRDGGPAVGGGKPLGEGMELELGQDLDERRRGRVPGRGGPRGE